MARRYAVTGEENAVTAAYTTAGRVTGTAAVRALIADILLSHGGAAADNVITWTAMRHTIAPTDTAVVPAALDPGNPAAVVIAGENASAEGTVTAASELFEIDLNQRATQRIVFVPGYELVAPATAANGISIRCKSAAYTGVAKTSLHFEE